jgi:DNA-binding MarR family transcriptional regulator
MSTLSSDGDSTGHWTFLTSHTQVLLCLARDPNVRLRDVALSVGITERATQKIVSDLVEAGYIERERIGRRNQYNILSSTPMRHAAQREVGIGELLELLVPRSPA